MSRALLLVTVALALPSCQSERDVANARTFAEDDLSLVPPQGWEVKRQKDTLVFVGGAPNGSGRPTIALRSVPSDGWSEPRTPDTVLPSVENVLRALPAARVTGPTWIDHPAYRAAAYEVVFKPLMSRGHSYERRHVVVFAGDHVFHAFLTGPAGRLQESRAAFERLLASLREEV